MIVDRYKCVALTDLGTHVSMNLLIFSHCFNVQ